MLLNIMRLRLLALDDLINGGDMPPRSKIEQLPDNIRVALEKRLIGKGFSDYGELESWLNKKGYQVSRSSIHRFGQRFEERIKALKSVTEQAKVIVEESRDEDGAMNEALQRLAAEKAYQILLEMEVSPDDISLSGLIRSISDLGRASVTQKKFANDIRREYAEETAKKLNGAVKTGKLDPEAARNAMQIMGWNDE